MPTLLITGGAGFIGGHTATMAIQRGWQVRLLDNLSTGLATKSDRLASEGAEVIIGDVRDEAIVQAAVEGCDAVIHLAAQVSVPRSVEQPEETLAINVGGTANLLNACKKHGVSRFVMASSAAVYGTNDALPLDEAHAGTCHSPYAESTWTNGHRVAAALASGL
ncbi:MAG: GDP-mannose 4,6-dehydratase, partial [Candidatus Poseidoniales archaeon]